MAQEETNQPEEEITDESLESEEGGTPSENDEIDDGCGKTKP